MRISDRRAGMALLETVLVIPLLLLLLFGIQAIDSLSNVQSMAESAVHAETLRISRGQTTLAPEWNRLLPDAGADAPAGDDPGFRFSSSGNSSRLLPSPFPALSGRTAVSIGKDLQWPKAVQATLGIGPPRITRRSELSGDCWNRDCGSGRRITGSVRVLALAALIR